MLRLPVFEVDMHLSLPSYKTLVFDCDGVILNSNKLKTEAFYQVALPYGEDAAQALVNFHVQNGGISRYRKFEYFLQTIIGEYSQPETLNELLLAYASTVRVGLLTCSLAPRLLELRNYLPNTRWLIVSGGDQSELRQVFTTQGIAHLFDGGIFGSPDTKEQILLREKERINLITPALFLGDSQYDYLAASQTGLDFIFISGWTEMKGWLEFCSRFNLPYIESIDMLIPSI
ncbi:HAD family hydrolase [Nostoc sp. CALU 1950]|uniref:HAD family hydrolase n=1 Tax=Nostoc sp. CALU 1950 TaxID=3104321 RepID=UPI003EC0D0B8